MRRTCAGRERDLEAVGRRVRQAVDAVRPEVVILPLLAIGDDRRAGGLEPLDGVADRRVVERVERGIVGVAVAATASISSSGRGMLPIGSVGIVIMETSGLVSESRRRIHAWNVTAPLVPRQSRPIGKIRRLCERNGALPRHDPGKDSAARPSSSRMMNRPANCWMPCSRAAVFRPASPRMAARPCVSCERTNMRRSSSMS